MYTDEQILKEIQRVASTLHKKSVSIADFDKYGNISSVTVSNRFGSWNEAVEKAGLEPIDPIERARSTPSLSEDDLLLDLIRLFKEYGTEGLRIWTGRPFFNDHPDVAIQLLSQLRNDESEYVRKSVGNALRDISKKHKDLVKIELYQWDITTKQIKQTHALASKFL